MSADTFSLFYCLTEEGWLPINEGEAPEGWVRIYQLRVYQGSPFGRESREWQSPKTNPTWTENDADILEGKFSRPEKLSKITPEILKSIGS